MESAKLKREQDDYNKKLAIRERDMYNPKTKAGSEARYLASIISKDFYNARKMRIAAEENCKVILGVDAHGAFVMRNPEAEAKAMGLVKKYDLNLQQTISLRDIRKV